MKTIKRSGVLLAGLAVFALLAGPMARAGHTEIVNYAEDTLVQVDQTELKIMAGSVQEGLEIGESSLTVTVPANEAFFLRSLGPNPYVLENDGLLPTCNVLQNRDNQIRVQGPRSVTFTPSQYACSTANYGQDNTPLIHFSNLTGGEVLQPGQQFQLFWQTDGIGANSVRMRLSVDNGATYEQGVVSGLMNNGYYNWTVPEVYYTEEARIKMEGMNGQGDILAAEVSEPFVIEGEPEPEPPAPPEWNFDPAAATAAASSIDVNQDLTLPAGATASDCVGMRIKTADSDAVYYCGQDGKRHAFPNQRIHASWYGASGNWGGVVEVSASYLAGLPLGENVLYRPGVRMVKITTDPKTYAVGPDGVLRWVPSEEAAIALYGADWNQQIDDLPDAFFTDYVIGDAIAFE